MVRKSRPEPDGNQSVAVSVAVLEALADAGRPLGVTELAVAGLEIEIEAVAIV